MIAVGDEASYLTMEKSDQFAFNPFVRIANGSDSPAVVRNGRVFDPAFYQSRFGFDTPDLVINTVGTNDVRDLASSAIYDAIYSNDTLMHSQILAAWPSAKVIRSVPGTSYNSTRNALWASHYAPMIRALKAAAVTVGSKVIVPPLWAMTNPEVGYAIGLAVPTGNDGFKVSDWSDNTHPSGASRQALFKALAPFVAAAKINLM
jgi:lysophospholipase L1-like esterase